MQVAIALLLALFTCCARAEWNIVVLPFDLKYDYTLIVDQLTKLNDQSGRMNGAVIAKSYGLVDHETKTITVGFRSPVMYIATEIQQSPCAYKMIREHEDHHVEIYVNALKVARRELSQRLRETDDQQALAVLKQWIDNVIEKQRQHDSPGEYRRIERGCNGEIRRLSGL